MPIQPDFVERAAIRTNLAPAVLLDFLGAQAFRAVCAAFELGVFEALARGSRSAREVAGHVHASERGVRLLLDALEAVGYVRSRDGRYAPTRITTRWGLDQSPTSLARGIPFFESMVFDRWRNLAESIRRGTPVVHGDEWLGDDPQRWSHYEDAMMIIARAVAPEIVSKATLPRTARRLLDIGGGHGLYAIEFCRRHENLSAAIFDLAPALESARRTIAGEDMAARVTTIEGDLRSGDWGSGYDLALLFNILHLFPAGENIDLLQRVSKALHHDGLVVILEPTPERAAGAAGRALARLQALNFYNDFGGESHTTEEIRRWLAAAGFARGERASLRSMPGFTLLTASKNA